MGTTADPYSSRARKTNPNPPFSNCPTIRRAAGVPRLDGRRDGTSTSQFFVSDGGVPFNIAGSAMLPKVTTSPILCINLERIGTDVFGISLPWEWQLRATKR